MKTNCINCGNENPKNGMKTCCRKCADELKKKNSREKRECLFCKNEFEVRKKEERKLCSDECRKSWALTPENKIIREKIFKDSVKAKYGVENVFSLKEFQEKAKQVKLEKYGDEYYCNKEKQTETLKKIYGDDYYINLAKKRKQTTIERYGVEHHLQLPEFMNKQKQTNLERYGVESVSQLEEVQNKIIKTTRERFGVDNASQSEEIKKKKKQTSVDNFGVSHHLKDYDLFQKHLKAQYKVFEYKTTGIHYQGSYEKYFLELLEEKGLLNEVSNGKSFEYIWENETHMYHTDFLFRGQHIEIKSGWTYNNNGKNLELQKFNETKWESVKLAGESLIILINKDEIKGFIKALL